MRSLSDKTRPDSDGSASSKKDSLRKDNFVSWDSKEINEEADLQIGIIKSANKKIKLFDIFKRYDLKFQETPSGSGWRLKTRCPFPFHKGGKEKTPSFYYNPKENRFKCHGCGQGGQAVEFMSGMDGVPKIEIATKILQHYGSLETTIQEINDSEDENIDETLFDFFSYIENKLKNFNHIDNFHQNIENILWSFDVFLATKTGYDYISNAELEARIRIYKEAIEGLIE